MNQASPPREKGEDPILFQQYFQTVGRRTYAAQVKQARNGNHYLVLTEGKRDRDSDQVRKTRLFVFSEDFVAFFRLLHETAVFIRANPVPDEVRRKRAAYWKKAQGNAASSPNPGSAAPKDAPPARARTSAAARLPVTPRPTPHGKAPAPSRSSAPSRTRANPAASRRATRQA